MRSLLVLIAAGLAALALITSQAHARFHGTAVTEPIVGCARDCAEKVETTPPQFESAPKFESGEEIAPPIPEFDEFESRPHWAAEIAQEGLRKLAGRGATTECPQTPEQQPPPFLEGRLSTKAPQGCSLLELATLYLTNPSKFDREAQCTPDCNNKSIWKLLGLYLTNQVNVLRFERDYKAWIQVASA